MARRLLVLAMAFSVVAPPAAQTGRLSPWLETALRQERAGARHLVWIYFRDKGPDAGARAAAAGVTSRRAQLRRAISST